MPRNTLIKPREFLFCIMSIGAVNGPAVSVSQTLEIEPIPYYRFSSITPDALQLQNETTAHVLIEYLAAANGDIVSASATPFLADLDLANCTFVYTNEGMCGCAPDFVPSKFCIGGDGGPPSTLLEVEFDFDISPQWTPTGELNFEVTFEQIFRSAPSVVELQGFQADENGDFILQELGGQ